jgi:hypothetical protein
MDRMETWVVEIKTPRGSLEVDVPVDLDFRGDNLLFALGYAQGKLRDVNSRKWTLTEEEPNDAETSVE